MVQNISDVTQAHEALRIVGGLPVTVNADFALCDNGKLVIVATTDEQFTAGVTAAIALSPLRSCFIHRLA